MTENFHSARKLESIESLLVNGGRRRIKKTQNLTENERSIYLKSFLENNNIRDGSS